MSGAASTARKVRFIQSQPPALKSGTYTVVLSHALGGVAYSVPDLVRSFAVSGERFALDPTEIQAVFPPHLATGEFAGVLPHVVLAKHVLPWERTIVPSGVLDAQTQSTWLAVLLFDGDTAPVPNTAMTVKDLVP